MTLDLSYAEATPFLPFQSKRIKIVVVGLGGNGGFLARHAACLLIFLRTLGKQATLTFIDPDRVEEVNIPRQNFCAAEIGRYKAEALARRYADAFGVDIGCIPEAFDPGMVKAHWEVLTILVGCVDGAAGRIAMEETLKQNREYQKRKNAPRIIYLDLGNGLDYGQVLLGTTERVDDLATAFSLSPLPYVSLLPSPLLQQPQLREPRPEERQNHDLSCAALLAANAQALLINPMMAAEAADYLYRLLVTGNLKKFATFIDLPTGTKRSHYTTPATLARVIGCEPAFFQTSQEPAR
jgi:PRTRC genetic system ThiF family protein